MTHQQISLAAALHGHQTVEVAVIPPLDLRGMLQTVWQGKWLILLTTFAIFGMAGYYAFQITQPRYTATATLTIDPQTPVLRDVSGQWPAQGTDPASLNTEAKVLTSDHVLGQVVTELNLLADPEFNRYLHPVAPFSVNTLRTKMRHVLSGTQETVPDAAAVFDKTIQNLRGTITVTRPRDTYIFAVSAASGTPDKAALLANAVAEVYLTTQMQAKDSAAQSAETWLAGRVNELRQQLAAQEIAVTNLIATAQLQEDAGLDALSTQILAADQTLAETHAALARMEQSDTVASVRRQAEMAQLDHRITALAGNRHRLQAQLSAQSAGLVLLQQMQREADATRVVYETFLARLQETRIARGLDQLDGMQITPATSARYTGPRKVLILTLGVMVGGLTGLGLVVLRATMRSGFQTSASLRQASGLHVLSEIPLQKIRRPKRLLSKIIDTPRSPVADAVRSMRTSLFLDRSEEPPQVILSTSSIEGEGKTIQALILAQTIAGLEKSVVVIDADLRNSSFTRFLQSKPRHGWIDVLQGHATISDALVQDPHLQCAVLFGQPSPAQNPADILASDGFATLLQTLRQQFDHIILDMPAVISAPDVQIVAPQVDAIIYAVQWAKTPVATLQLGLQTLADAGAPAPRLVLAKVDVRQRRRHWPATAGPYGATSLQV